ncbi:RagB/SusD family nutrient uptake outer membrane protein [Sphingobacterium olei]|uniref:RagB/SusD family nutrient uptake outer membrane protein n=2 Tax=Sphingobacterium olei TaxID=2571155 RepID=A0A4U0P2P2_9SPHI|nr:RagB/SusD family nutrient uptake outer membrane protein [Sphingobacterium olei]
MKHLKISQRKFFIPLLLLAILVSSSCSRFLNVDDYFSDELKLDTVFAQTRHIKAYMWGTAGMFPDEGNLQLDSYTPGPYATDEAFTGFNTGSGYNGIRYILGDVTANSLYSFNTWGNLYKIIRKSNTIVSRLDEAKDMTTADRFYILAYTRFIRAYAYYNILIDFGPPMLLGDEIIESNAPLGNYDRPRATYDEAVEYICAELEEAAKFLPPTLPLVEFGLPSKNAAYGLIARIRLFHASPLYNGGQAARSYFGTWRRSTDGAQYVSQNYDEKRWAVAAAAAKRLIDQGGGALRLHTVAADTETPALPEGVTSDPNYYMQWPEGANGIDHYRSYSEMFNGEAVIPVNPEYVWARRSGAITNETRMSFPEKLDGYNGASLTQKVIDNFAMIDGRDINNASIQYPYTESGFTNAAKIFSGYRLNAGVSNMYANREARFYASVGFSGAFWPMTSSTSSGYYNQTIEYYFDSPNGKGSISSAIDFPITGYVIKKFIHPTDAWGGTNARRMDKAFPIIRYAEILLSYAEALNNLTGSHTVDMDGDTYVLSRDMNEIKKCFNQVRYRAGLPGITGNENASTFQRLLEKERMTEFLFENRRYYDVRRWGIMEEVESEAIRGMNVEASREAFFAKVIPNTSRIGARIVNKRLALLPLPLNEVRLLPSLDQNPGWEN